MFDTMTLSKLLGAVCGGVLVLLVANYLGDMIYSPAEAGAPAYMVVAAAAETPTPAAETQGPDFKQALAEADVSHGQQLFSRCKACHRLDNKNATGPHLNGVVGRKVAGLQDYSYSGALRQLGGDWTPERLDDWLKKPAAVAPGTKMGFPGLPRLQDRADLIAYLATVK